MTMHQEVSDVVRAVWRTVLEVPDAEAAPDFFAAGGTSATAIVLMERVEAELGIEFPLETLFLRGDLQSVIADCDGRYAGRVREPEA
jgi:hypothetical protein